jgi:hypothetical protein
VFSDTDLANALVRFHISLSAGELNLLFHSFLAPSPDGDGTIFDMRALAEALFRRGEEQAFGRDDSDEKKLRPPQRGMKRAADSDNETRQTQQQQYGVATTRTNGAVFEEQKQQQTGLAIASLTAADYTVGPAAPAAGTKSGLIGQRRDISGGGVAAALGDWGASASSPRGTGAAAYSSAAGRGGFAITRGSGPRPTVDSLHTPRGSSLLAKAGSNSLAITSSSARRGATSTRKATSSAAAAQPLPPRIDFLNLSKYDTARRFDYTADRQQQGSASRQPFVHTAR